MERQVQAHEQVKRKGWLENMPTTMPTSSRAVGIELAANWENMKAGRPLEGIAPLKENEA